MTKDSIIELQKIDCNCNDCIFMGRDFDTFKKWEKFKHELQLKEFERKKAEALRIANECQDERGKQSLLSSANKMVFMFDRKGLIHYGNCDRFKKPVSFIPNVCQLKTQQCFKHRREP